MFQRNYKREPPLSFGLGMLKAYLLRPDKSYRVYKIDNLNDVILENGLYAIDAKAVKRSWKHGDNRLGDGEIFFFTGKTTPLTIKKPKGDISKELLGRYVVINALEQTGSPLVLSGLTNSLKSITSWLTLGRAFQLIFFMAIFYTLLRSVLGI